MKLGRGSEGEEGKLLKHSGLNIQPNSLDTSQPYRVKVKGRWIKVRSLKDVYRVLRIKERVEKKAEKRGR